MIKRHIFSFLATCLIVAGCSSEQEDNSNDSSGAEDAVDEAVESVEEPTVTDSENELNDVETDTYDNEEGTEVYLEENTYIEESESPYTREELESDPYAPSTNPNDYDENGQYVPAEGPSDNPADYDVEGNYRPIEDMTEAEKQAELEEMLERSLEQ